MKNTTRNLEKTVQFGEATWNRLCGLTAKAFRFDAEETQRLHNNRTPRLIAAIPFLAGCHQAERTALAHLAIYVLSCKPGTRLVFDHQPADDQEVMARLAAIMRFEGGDPAIIERGMKLLAVQMICGYGRDLAKDAVTREYNPLLSGAWNGMKLINSLVMDIMGVSCPGMDMIMTIEEAKNFWWDQ